jgi:hypothetical protein
MLWRSGILHLSWQNNRGIFSLIKRLYSTCVQAKILWSIRIRLKLLVHPRKTIKYFWRILRP